jgi:hypothetical protein
MEKPPKAKRQYNGPPKGSDAAKERMQRVRASRAAPTNATTPRPQTAPPLAPGNMGHLASLQSALASSGPAAGYYQRPSWF